MNDNQTEQAIQAKGLTAPRITPDQIAMLHASLTYVTSVPEGSTSTFVHAYLPGTSGRMFHLATGHSACVSPENFNAELGYNIAFSKAQALAKDKLWELEGYRLFRELNP
jgi:hypothetical protein